MTTAKTFAVVLGCGAVLAAAGAANAQNYPNRVVRIITAEVGAGGDFASRLIAQVMSGPLGQQVIVDNRSGFMSIETVAKAAPDGYTLLLYGTSMWTVPLFRRDVSWDPLRDFEPIALVASSPNMLVVHPSLPVKSVSDLIRLAKARPGALNYGSGPPGSANQLAGELFKAMAGVDIVQINYKGNGPALNALIAGEVQLFFVTAVSVTPHVKSGRLRGLAVTSIKPSALAPGFPTVAASLPGYESTSKWGLFAPRGTAGAILNRLSTEAVRALNHAEVKERLFNTGVEAIGSSPEELAAVIKSETERLGKIVKNAGLREQ